MNSSFNDRIMVKRDNLKFLKEVSPPTQIEINNANERINQKFVPSTIMGTIR